MNDSRVKISDLTIEDTSSKTEMKANFIVSQPQK